MIAMHTIEPQCWKYTIARLSYSVTAYQTLLTFMFCICLHLSYFIQFKKSSLKSKNIWSWQCKRQTSIVRDHWVFCIGKHMSVWTKPIPRPTYVSPCKIRSSFFLYFFDVLKMFFSTWKMKSWFLSFYLKNEPKF